MVNPMSTEDIVRRASDYVYQLFQETLPDWAVYHNYEHTVETVEAAAEIGQDSKLNKSELEIVALAAWFHDTGYTGGSDGHEEKSADAASKFLGEAVYHNYEHTVETGEAAAEIGQDSKLNKSELEIVALAAWFHDTGYTGGSDGHEEKSADAASKFLGEAGYPPERIPQVADLIRAPKKTGTPKNRME